MCSKSVIFRNYKETDKDENRVFNAFSFFEPEFVESSIIQEQMKFKYENHHLDLQHLTVTEHLIQVSSSSILL